MSHTIQHSRIARHAILAYLASLTVTALALGSQGLAAQARTARPSEPDAAIAASSSTTPDLPKRDQADPYLIGPGDLLAITVWKDPELSRTMPVRPDGRISLPLIGEVAASGLTAAGLQSAIIEKLVPFMSHPEVNVIVQEIRSRHFNIVGKVNKAGVYDLLKPTTVLDGLAQAGGFQDFARVTKIYVLRRAGDNSTRMLPFNYKQVVKGRALDQNLQLEPGDTIVVP